METPQFIQDGQFTPDGLQVKRFMEGLFAEADRTNDLHTLNSLSGHIADYYLQAYKGAGRGFGVTPETWFTENKVAAANAYRDMRHFAELAEQEVERVKAINEATQNTSELAAKLEELREKVRELTEALAAKTAAEVAPAPDAAPVEEAAPEPKKRARKGKADVVEAEAEADEDADAEDAQPEAPAADEQADAEAEADEEADEDAQDAGGEDADSKS